MGKKKVLVIAVYSHPEYYPPTLNAIENLAPAYDAVYIVHRNVSGFDWQYPANVQLVAPRILMGPREAEAASMPKKIGWFLYFTWLFYTTVKKQKADTVLMYDALPLLSYRLFRNFLRAPRLLWYHNHDVTDLQYTKKFSLGWWAWRSEQWIFPRLQLFTLPALERQPCFNMQALKGRFVFVPNYPSVKVYQPWLAQKKASNPACLLYQGSIGPAHGLEEIIPLLATKPGGKDLMLVLKGFISAAYLQQLQALAAKHQVADKLLYRGSGGYSDVIANAAGCHIGIAIHQKNDVMNKTLGTASNKIYEYAALGLPVLLYDNIHFRQHLDKYAWALFTDCSAGSISRSLESIFGNYEALSAGASADWKQSLNFEHYFLPVMELVNSR